MRKFITVPVDIDLQYQEEKKATVSNANSTLRISIAVDDILFVDEIESKDNKYRGTRIIMRKGEVIHTFFSLEEINRLIREES